jgi:putative cardiolipin synthase
MKACVGAGGVDRAATRWQPRLRAGSVVRAAALVAAAAFVSGCATLPPLDGRTASSVLPAAAGTRLHSAIAPATTTRAGQTGIFPLIDGGEAFAARVALAESAERTLDLQYYIWHGDVSGRLMFETVRRAADRGVRVRLLLDDNNTKGLDATLAALDAHPNVEVRLFNPFASRKHRLLGYATDFGRLNRRMHNKSFTADGVATIVGGRNVGDEYFAATDAVGFVDLDVVAIGAAVDDVAKSFDDYWASESSYPVDRLLPAATPADVAALAARGRATLESDEARRYADSLRESGVVRDLLQRRSDWEWGEAQLVVDDPRKGLGRAERKDYLMSSLEHVLGPIRRELHLVSPYFVPMKEGVAALSAMERRGVQVAVLTNSLEATDVAAVHAGYAKRRRALLDAGVQLYEMKRSAAAVPVGIAHRQRWFTGGRGSGPNSGSNAAPGSTAGSDLTSGGSSGGASLHAKTFAVDRERIFVGSFNFDPRSAALNTEMGLVIRSPALAGRLADLYAQQIPQISYEVRRAAGGGLEWVEREGSVEWVHTTEPGTTRLQRFGVGVLQRLPIDWLL